MFLGIALLWVAFLTGLGTLRIISAGVKNAAYFTVVNGLSITIEVLAAIKLMR